MADEHVCGICKEATVLEVTTHCRQGHHHFCGKCIVRWMVQKYYPSVDSFRCPTCEDNVFKLEYAANEGEGQEGRLLAKLTNLFSELHEHPFAISYEQRRRYMFGTIRAFMADEGDDIFLKVDLIRGCGDLAAIDDITFLRRYVAFVVVAWVLAIGAITAMYL